MLSYSLRSLAHRKLRAYLTILGIVIGVASVVTLISISDGLYASVQTQLEEFGSRVVAIIPGSPSSTFAPSGGGYIKPTAGRLYEKDLQRIERIIGASGATAGIRAKTTLFFKKQNITITVTAIEPSKYEKVREVKIEEGRYLSDNERHTALIGSSYATTDILEQPMSVGSVFYMGKNHTRYRVVGIIDRSSSLGKTNIFVTFDDGRELAGNTLGAKEISAISFTVPEGYDFDSVVAQAKSDLSAARGVREDDPDFTVVTADFILEQVGAFLAILTAILGFIIGVSLLVGGVGVANTMFVSVLEKTKEIGTLKAIGATSSDILMLVLLESAAIGLMGGIIGLALSAAIVFIISLFDFTAVITIYTVAFALLFSMSISMVAGFIPARNASKLSPIEALRYD